MCLLLILVLSCFVPLQQWNTATVMASIMVIDKKDWQLWSVLCTTNMYNWPISCLKAGSLYILLILSGTVGDYKLAILQ